jgi:HK97 family phage prohead protease
MSKTVPTENLEELDRAARGESSPAMERRIYTNVQLEVREASGAPAQMCGYAAVFNMPADLGYFIETVKPGAFTRSIAQDDIRALFNHDPNLVLGRNKAQPTPTLALREDPQGLYMMITPAARSYELDLMQSMRRGDVSQASISFIVKSRTLREDGDELYRDINEVQLFDVSPVTFPAYTQTTAGMRSLEAIVAEFRRGPETPQPTDEAWKRDLDHRERMLQLVRD